MVNIKVQNAHLKKTPQHLSEIMSNQISTYWPLWDAAEI